MSWFKKREPLPASDDPTSIGNVLIKMGFVTQEQLQAVVDRQQKMQREVLGELLVAAGYCTREQVDSAYVKQLEMRGKKVDYAAEGVRVLSRIHDRVSSLDRAMGKVHEEARVAASKK